ncbi:hypothetical protein [Dietzia cinnamea]|uniref:Uncharacterized protein n=1 Tax=Dietzia cinnamea TaxID=321318 RepID=A0A177LDJ4_9ACTN|nr:hypothetical protein [Dietzia cinnamea]OAH63798.1 hypothetical protein AYJ66_09795 [Dietzia cinnamea]TCW21175.1 hypothetical protein EDD19_12711 [Dietzia cinnamea]
MAHFRVLPHRVASAASIKVEQWWYRLGDGEISDLPELVPGWDYNTHTVVGVDVEINTEELTSSTGLPIEAIELVITLDCPAVSERFLEKSAILDGPQSLAVEIPSGRAADSFIATAHLVAKSTEPLQQSPASVRSGARLFTSEPQRAQLEGSGGRFPVEVCGFSSIGFESAPWTLVSDFEELSDSFMGSIRLFVNSEHPLGALAAKPAQNATAARLMQIDTMRLLIAEIARSGMYESHASWPDGSVSYVVDSMCSAYFNRELSTMIQLLSVDPAAFERLLYDSLPFDEVASL